MDVNEFISKNKSKVLNIVILIIAAVIAVKIYNQQMRAMEALKAQKDLEAKRSATLESISSTEKGIYAYKNLLSRKDTSEVINTISNIAKELNVTIVSVKPLPQQKSSEYIKIPFNLVVTSPDYNALGNFISKIESYYDVYMVESIEIRLEQQLKQLNANLTISSVAYKF